MPILLVAVGLAGLVSRAAFAADSDSSVAAAVASIRTPDFKRHINFLAGDSLEGREAGTRGGHAAGAYLRERYEELKLDPGNAERFFQEFGNDQRNILGVLTGSDPTLRDEVIVLGAHYDHVGYGYSGNSRGRPGQIHNGADDNASGVSTLLEIAQALKMLPQPPRRTILFALWDGEELGLLGSTHWVRQPTLARDRIRFYINLDMVGRLRDNSLDVYGIRTAPGLRAIYARNNFEGISAAFDWNLIPDSDHYPFLERRIPFMMPYTRKHADYHLPTDDADKIVFDGIERIGRHWFRILLELATADALPAFRDAALRENEATRKASEKIDAKAVSRLGISWISEESDRAGRLAIQTVTPGSAADTAGLRAGDRIAELNGLPYRSSSAFIRDLLRSETQSEMTIEREIEGRMVRRVVPIRLAGEPIHIGFGWRDDSAEPGVLILDEVIPQSPADVAGLKPLDRVMSVNDLPADPDGGTYRQLAQQPGPFRIVYERDGRPAATTLQRVELLAPPVRAPRPESDGVGVSPEPRPAAATVE